MSTRRGICAILARPVMLVFVITNPGPESC